MKASVASTIVTALLAGCSGASVEQGLFFPTWSAEGDVPGGQVFGTLIEDDRCLYVEANDQRTLVVWEDGMGFENGALHDASGLPIAQVGDMIHGGGGYYDSPIHIENLSGGVDSGTMYSGRRRRPFCHHLRGRGRSFGLARMYVSEK